MGMDVLERMFWNMLVVQVQCVYCTYSYFSLLFDEFDVLLYVGSILCQSRRRLEHALTRLKLSQPLGRILYILTLTKLQVLRNMRWGERERR